MKKSVSTIELIKIELAWCFSNGFLSQGNTFDELAEFWSLTSHPFSILGCKGQLSALEKVFTTHWLFSITIPTLVLTGDEDIVLPPRFSQSLLNQIPNVTHYEFHRCGHIAHVEQPVKFCQVVSNFLSTFDDN